MLTKLSLWLLKISTPLLVLICLALFLVFSALVLPDQTANAETYSAELGSPDTSLFYTAADLYRMAEGYGAHGRAAYIRARFTFDLIFPLVYTAFLVTAISLLTKTSNLSGPLWARINLLPISGMVFDFLENISASIVISRYPHRTAVIDSLAGIFTLFKWVFLVASFLVLVILAVFSWRRRARFSNKRE